MEQVEEIKVLIADDHTLLRQGLRRILEMEPRIKVLDEVGDGQGAVNLVRQLKPDVVLMDLNMPGLNGIEASKIIKRENHRVGIIILTAHDDDDQIFQVIQAGVDGYILKDVDPDSLYHAIICVARGESVINPAVMSKVLGQMRKMQAPGHHQEKHPDQLTEREWDVLKMIAKGADNRTIADTLFISEKTVKNHITNIFRKLQVKDRTQAAIYAIRNNLVQP